MFGLSSGYSSMAEACGEAPPSPLVFIPGEDFDPYDEDDRETVGAAMEKDAYDRVRVLEEENARLRAELAERGE